MLRDHLHDQDILVLVLMLHRQVTYYLFFEGHAIVLGIRSLPLFS